MCAEIDDGSVENHSHVEVRGHGNIPHPLLVEPANTVKGSVQLGGLIYVDAARSLGMGLAERLALVVMDQALEEDAALAGEICSGIQPQVGRDLLLIGVK